VRRGLQRVKNTREGETETGTEVSWLHDTVTRKLWSSRKSLCPFTKKHNHFKDTKYINIK
jgi:hypothetical protein